MIERTTEVVAVGVSAVELYRKVKAFTPSRYSITITSDDRIYGPVCEKLISTLNPTSCKGLMAFTLRRDDPFMEQSTNDVTLHTGLSGDQTHSITIERYKVDAIMESEETSSGHTRRKTNLIFKCRSYAAQQATFRFIESVIEENFPKKSSKIFFADKWGGWREHADLPVRPLDTVVLKAGQKERLQEDLESFLAQEDEYARMGVPWRRGYLLTGPPGTGKTSIARALAASFDMDIYFLPLSDQKGDGDLLTTCSEIKPRSVLLLEDVDVMSAATKRDDESPVTLSGLLNAIDGITTPHGVVVIMTSNVPEKIDAALTRPGRIDRHEHIDYLDNAEIDQLVKVMSDVDVKCHFTTLPSPASIVEMCKRHMGDPDGLKAALYACVCRDFIQHSKMA